MSRTRVRGAVCGVGFMGLLLPRAGFECVKAREGAAGPGGVATGTRTGGGHAAAVARVLCGPLREAARSRRAMRGVGGLPSVCRPGMGGAPGGPAVRGRPGCA
ncbi:hypothetical protein GCM10023223_05360 [Stackebrandtia albiflava]